MKRQVVMNLIQRAPRQKRCGKTDTKCSSTGLAASNPSSEIHRTTAGTSSCFGRSHLCVDEQRCNTAIAQLPDCTIQNEVMDVHQRSEDQKALREIEVKDMRNDPRSRNEERDATRDQNSKIPDRTPVLAPLGVRLSPGVVTRDPQILCGVHYCEHSHAVAVLGNVKSLSKSQCGRQQKPDKLRRKQGNTLFATQFIWFLLPTALAFGEGLHIPQNRYSMGVLA